jgi:hypothetical protein
MCCRLDGHMFRTHNVLMNGERIDADFEYFPTLLPLNGQIRLFIRRLTTAMALRALRLLGNGIHVPPMTSTWLVMHEVEHGKHPHDL